MIKKKLNNKFVISVCKLALNEDLFPDGDITSNLIDKNVIKKLKLVVNEECIFGGIEFAKQTFKLIDSNIKFTVKKRMVLM